MDAKLGACSTDQGEKTSKFQIVSPIRLAHWLRRTLRVRRQNSFPKIQIGCAAKREVHICPHISTALSISPRRGVAVNELVFAQRHNDAQLSAQTNKSHTVLSSSPHSASSSHRCGQRFHTLLVCALRGNPLHNVEGLRPGIATSVHSRVASLPTLPRLEGVRHGSKNDTTACRKQRYMVSRIRHPSLCALPTRSQGGQ